VGTIKYRNSKKKTFINYMEPKDILQHHLIVGYDNDEWPFIL